MTNGVTTFRAAIADIKGHLEQVKKTPEGVNVDWMLWRIDAAYAGESCADFERATVKRMEQMRHGPKWAAFIRDMSDKWTAEDRAGVDVPHPVRVQDVVHELLAIIRGEKDEVGPPRHAALASPPPAEEE